ncbi:ATP-dependent helicase [Euzebya tangerina]|uniref:ATP-dependent helicase n=1 Tax=Euzebya tangerina TaxID=591198 RepID=UPI000E3207E8|nr:ATP-dependent helicase [Euzebya tangerina]
MRVAGGDVGSGSAEAPRPFGRGAIVQEGQQAPTHLATAQRVRLDGSALARPQAVIDRLHRAWASRTPVVVELVVDPAELTVQERSTEPVHSHRPTMLFPRERLRHLVWANSLDCRGGAPIWWHAVKAARASGGRVVAGGPADALVVAADGEEVPVWIDGGPRRSWDVEHPVLHREDTQRGTVILPTGAGRVGVGAAPTGLAPDQAAAVQAPGGSVRVAAPAGSGKTRVLTARLQELLGHRQAPPGTVLALAYNTKAAAEMRARSRAGRGSRRAQVATVHSHALAILRRHRPGITVLDERDVRALLGQLIEPPRRANVDPLQPYIDALETVRTALKDPAEVQEDRDDVEDLDRIFGAYRAVLADRNAVDFPEMVYAAIERLLVDPAARAAEQSHAEQVLVDEFQDLTPAYLLLIRLLASPQLQCFGVGDDDQVIYGHAGATPQYLLDFDQLFPGSEDHPLTVNYRCPAPVVRGAVALLDNNAVRLDKQINPGPDAGQNEIAVHRVHTTEQARTAGSVIADALDAGRGADDLAVLARIKVALLGTQADLAGRGIPTRSPIGEWLLQRTTVRAALAYLRLATDDHLGGEDLAEILHRPLRAIPGAMRDTLRRRDWTPQGFGDFCHSTPGRSGRALQRMERDLTALRGRAQRQPTTEVLRYVADVIGLGDVAASLDASAGDQIAASHIDDLDALLQVADHCPEPTAFERFLTDVVRQPDPGGPAVTLSTIHSVKGLEWPHVVVVGAGEGVNPHRLATTPPQIEEERRVFHVAMTRAGDQLTVIAPQTGTSRFVDEMLGKTPLVGASAAARPAVGRATTTQPRATRPKVTREGTGSRRTATATPARPQFRAAPGLALKASGGLEGVVESVTDDGALVRTPRGSLLRVTFGSEVRVDGDFGTLTRPT